jgi:hypothetical protein
MADPLDQDFHFGTQHGASIHPIAFLRSSSPGSRILTARETVATSAERLIPTAIMTPHAMPIIKMVPRLQNAALGTTKRRLFPALRTATATPSGGHTHQHAAITTTAAIR